MADKSIIWCEVVCSNCGVIPAESAYYSKETIRKLEKAIKNWEVRDGIILCPECAAKKTFEKPADNWIKEAKANREEKLKTLDDFRAGDKVRLADNNPHNARAARLPGYLVDGTLTVIGFSKTKVKCDWDGGKPFLIPPEMLVNLKEVKKNEQKQP